MFSSSSCSGWVVMNFLRKTPISPHIASSLPNDVVRYECLSMYGTGLWVSMGGYRGGAESLKSCSSIFF